MANSKNLMSANQYHLPCRLLRTPLSINKFWGFLDNDLQRLRTDVSVIKSLLLRGDQFPSIPTTNEPPTASRNGPTKNGHFTTEIPAWQIRENSAESDSMTPPEEEESKETGEQLGYPIYYADVGSEKQKAHI